MVLSILCSVTDRHDVAAQHSLSCVSQIVTTMVLSILCTIGVPGLLGSAGGWIGEAADGDSSSSSSESHMERCGCFPEYNHESGVTETICVDCVEDSDEDDCMKSGVSDVDSCMCSSVVLQVVHATNNSLKIHAICFN